MFFPPEIPIKGKLCDKVHTSPKQERSKSGFRIAIKCYFFYFLFFNKKIHFIVK